MTLLGFLIFLISILIYIIKLFSIKEIEPNYKRFALIKNNLIRKIYIIFIGFILMITIQSFVFLNVGEKAVVFNRLSGKADRVITAGFSFVTPFVDTYKIYDIKTRKDDFANIEGLSLDSQTILLNITINWRLDADKIKDIFNTIHGDFADTILYHAIQNIAKAELGKFRVDDIAKNRNSLKYAIEQELKKELKDRYIFIETVSVTNIDYSDKYESAIEAKLVAEQQALEAKNRKEKVRYEAEAKRIENENLASSITPLVLKQKWIEKWDGKLPNYIGGNSDLLMQIK